MLIPTEPERLGYYNDLRHIRQLATQAIIQLETAPNLTPAFTDTITQIAKQLLTVTERTVAIDSRDHATTPAR